MQSGHHNGPAMDLATFALTVDALVAGGALLTAWLQDMPALATAAIPGLAATLAGAADKLAQRGRG